MRRKPRKAAWWSCNGDICARRALAQAGCSKPDLLAGGQVAVGSLPVSLDVGTDNGALLELFATADGATWTALVTRANGMSCVVMNGDSWQYTPPHTLARMAP